MGPSSAFDIPNLFAFLMWRLTQMANLLLIYHLVLNKDLEITAMISVFSLGSLPFSSSRPPHSFTLVPRSDNLKQSLTYKTFTFVILAHVSFSDSSFPANILCCTGRKGQQRSRQQQPFGSTLFKTCSFTNKTLKQHICLYQRSSPKKVFVKELAWTTVPLPLATAFPEQISGSQMFGLDTR